MLLNTNCDYISRCSIADDKIGSTILQEATKGLGEGNEVIFGPIFLTMRLRKNIIRCFITGNNTTNLKRHIKARRKRLRYFNEQLGFFIKLR